MFKDGRFVLYGSLFALLLMLPSAFGVGFFLARLTVPSYHASGARYLGCPQCEHCRALGFLPPGDN